MTMHRRHFMQTSLGAAAAMSMAGRLRAASETKEIRVAQIGFNGQGGGHIKNFLDRGNPIIALCDVDEKVLNRKADEIKEKTGTRPELYSDYRKLLERNDIDAVSIAVPNHLHALLTIAGVMAGKHVYVEKPASHNIWEGRQMVAAARKTGKIVQIGTQCRSSIKGLKDAADWVQSGELGPIKYAVGTCYKRRPAIGKSDTPLVFPTWVNRDLWVGPAADDPIYRPEKNSQGGGKYNPHYDWHWDFNTGNGDLGNQGIHQMDVARWFLGEQALAPRVLSIGGRVGYKDPDSGNTGNSQIIFHDYAKAPLIFEVRGLPTKDYRGSGIGVVVQCEKGYVVIPTYTDSTAYDNDGKKIKEWKGGGNHHENWLQAIIANDPKILHADVHTGHVSSALCHTGNVSYRLGKKTATKEIAEAIKSNEHYADSFSRLCAHLKDNGVDVGDNAATLTMGEWLTVDPVSEQFVKNDAAMKLWTREYRKPFVVPDVESEMTGKTAAAG